MKANTFTIIALSILMVSCQDRFQEKGVFTESQEIEVTATFAEGSTKTVLSDNEKSVLWSPNDTIAVFYGNDAKGRFISQNKEPEATVVFKGSFNSYVDVRDPSRPFFGLYPYDANAECDGETVTTKIPTMQYAVPGTFAKGMFPTVAVSENLSLAFWSVCGGVCFTLSRSDINKVEITSNNGEALAGKIRLSFGESGAPSAEVINGASGVTLVPQSGDCFESGQLYFASLLPAKLDGGLTVSFYTSSWQKGCYTIPNPVTVKRSVFGKLTEKDKNCDWVNVENDLSSSGTANCYIVSRAGAYKFMAGVRGCSEIPVGNVAKAEAVWESFGTAETPAVGDIVRAVSYKDGYVHFSTPPSLRNGNTVIAVKDETGTILWSWHIWICDGYDPISVAQVYYNDAGTMMDRNMGATSATPGDVGALGLLYQWGRKDPFLTSCSISSDWEHASSTLKHWPEEVFTEESEEFMISHPTTRVGISEQAPGWPESSLKKGVHDPCPYGWRVPDGGQKGVWAKALGTSSVLEGKPWDDINRGMDFGSGNGLPKSMQLGDSPTIWYPAAGYINHNGGVSTICTGDTGFYWSVGDNIHPAFYFTNDQYGDNTDDDPVIYPWSSGMVGYCYSVRCVRDILPKPVAVTGVTLDQTELTITVGDQPVQLTATVAPDNATDKTVSWASDNTEVVTVDQDGKVTAVAPGEATITVTTNDGGKTATCLITVPAPHKEDLIFTALIDDTECLGTIDWKATDKVSINGILYNVAPDEQTDKATLTKNDSSADDPISPYEALFPASLYDGSKLVLPNTQTYADGMIINTPMCAKSTTEDLVFRSLCGFVKLAIKGRALVKEIHVIDSDKALCGPFTVPCTRAETGKSGTTTDEGTIKLDCGKGVQLNPEQATMFYIVVPDGQYHLSFKIIGEQDSAVYTCCLPAEATVNVEMNPEIELTTPETSDTQKEISVGDEVYVINPEDVPAGYPVKIKPEEKEGYEVKGITVSSHSNPSIVINIRPDGTFVMPDFPVAVKVTYKKIQYNINVPTPANGTVTLNQTSPCEWGTTVRITAIPDEGYAVGTLMVKDAIGNPVELDDGEFIMPQNDVTVIVSFQLRAFEITAAPSTGGSYVVQKGTPRKTETSGFMGEEIFVTASAETGYSGGTITVRNLLTEESVPFVDGKFIMPAAPVGINVTFVHDLYDIIGPATAPLNGTLTITRSGVIAETAYYGDEIVLTPTPDACFHVASLNVITIPGGEAVTITDNKFTMPASDVGVNVSFAKNQYILAKASCTNGSFTLSPSEGKIDWGTTVTVAPVPAEGYVIDTIKYNDGSDHDITSSLTFTMPTANVTVTVTFKTTTGEGLPDLPGTDW